MFLFSGRTEVAFAQGILCTGALATGDSCSVPRHNAGDPLRKPPFLGEFARLREHSPPDCESRRFWATWKSLSSADAAARRDHCESRRFWATWKHDVPVRLQVALWHCESRLFLGDLETVGLPTVRNPAARNCESRRFWATWKRVSACHRLRTRSLLRKPPFLGDLEIPRT